MQSSVIDFFPEKLLYRTSEKAGSLFIVGPRIYPTVGIGYQFQIKQQRNTKCNGCMSVVSNIKLGLGSNATTEEIQEVVNGACKVQRAQFTVQVRNKCT